MQGEQGRRQAGKTAQQKGVDAGIFQRLDRQALQRAPVVGDQRPAPAAMSGQVGEHGARCLTADSSVWSGPLIHDYIGWNYRLPELCAAVGLAQLERLDEFVAYRTKWAMEYEKLIKQVPWLVPQFVPSGMDRLEIR